MGRRSPLSNIRAGVVAGVVVAAVVAGAASVVSAHRLDEYLQAARVSIEPERVEIQLDLTPGAAVAARVLSELNADYVSRVVRDLSAEVDGRPLALGVLDRQIPNASEMMRGEGTIRIRLSAALPPLVPGAHRFKFRNGHHSDIGAYLANAMASTSWLVTVVRQDRDYKQSELTVDYVLRGSGLPGDPTPWTVGLVILPAVAVAGFLWRRRSRG